MHHATLQLLLRKNVGRQFFFNPDEGRPGPADDLGASVSGLGERCGTLPAPSSQPASGPGWCLLGLLKASSRAHHPSHTHNTLLTRSLCTGTPCPSRDLHWVSGGRCRRALCGLQLGRLKVGRCSTGDPPTFPSGKGSKEAPRTCEVSIWKMVGLWQTEFWALQVRCLSRLLRAALEEEQLLFTCPFSGVDIKAGHRNLFKVTQPGGI